MTFPQMILLDQTNQYNLVKHNKLKGRTQPRGALFLQKEEPPEISSSEVGFQKKLKLILNFCIYGFCKCPTLKVKINARAGGKGSDCSNSNAELTKSGRTSL